MYELDGVDYKIIDLLQNNARMSLKDIAGKVFSYLTSGFRADRKAGAQWCD